MVSKGSKGKEQLPAKRSREEVPSVLSDEQGLKSLVQAVSLVEVSLTRSEASYDRWCLDSKADLELSVSSPQFRVTVLRGEVPGLFCGVRLELNLQDSEGNTPVKILAEYDLLYSFEEDLGEIAEETARYFAGHNAVFNAWPFFRELASSTIGKMGLPPVVVPLMKLPVEAP